MYIVINMINLLMFIQYIKVCFYKFGSGFGSGFIKNFIFFIPSHQSYKKNPKKF